MTDYGYHRRHHQLLAAPSGQPPWLTCKLPERHACLHQRLQIGPYCCGCPATAELPGHVLAPRRLGNALEQTLRLALPIRPPRGTAEGTGAATLCPCGCFLSPLHPPKGTLRIA